MNRILFSSKSDHWSTPESVLASLGSFDMDPCPLMSDEDGLSLDWHGRVFVNPPYSDIKTWIEKVLFELSANHVTEVVCLLPARTDTKWFHDYVLPFSKEIKFIKGRLKFGGSKNNAPFPSMLVYF